MAATLALWKAETVRPMFTNSACSRVSSCVREPTMLCGPRRAGSAGRLGCGVSEPREPPRLRRVSQWSASRKLSSLCWGKVGG